MDKTDWENSLKHLIEMRDKYLKDLEEMNFTIECYEKKIKSL